MPTCSHCQKEGRLAAKGLCGTCYARHQRNGTAEYVRPNRSLGVTQCSHCEISRGPFIKTLCRACYQRQYKNGTPDLVRTRRLCEVSGCDEPVASHGLCHLHAMRVRRHGSADAGRPEGWGSKRKHPMYEAWQSMRRGARLSGGGDPRWADFWVFLEDMGERPEGCRLYRKDPTQPFSKSNCEWRATVLDAGHLATNAERQRVYRMKRPNLHSRLSRKKLYGITDDWYERTLAAQGGVCAICRGPETQKHAVTQEIIALAVDHTEDELGNVTLRGILCKACNTSIGGLKHDTDLLRAAIAYLDSHAEAGVGCAIESRANGGCLKPDAAEAMAETP